MKNSTKRPAAIAIGATLYILAATFQLKPENRIFGQLVMIVAAVTSFVVAKVCAARFDGWQPIFNIGLGSFILALFTAIASLKFQIGTSGVAPFSLAVSWMAFMSFLTVLYELKVRQERQRA